MTVAVPQQQYAAPAAYGQDERYIQHTPVWVVVVRGAQVLFGFVILCMAGYLIHGYALDANVYALVCGLLTFIVVGYILISEKVTSAQAAYNIWAVMSLDLLMAILWLASLGANAALRATFTVDVNVNGCSNNGQLVNSEYCNVSKRGQISRRGAVLFNGGPAILSAIAGLSALPWLLFVATLVYHGHTYRLWYEANKKPSADNATVEMKAQGTPMLAPQGGPAASAAGPYGAPGPQYSDQQQYQSQMYPPHEQPQQQQQQQQHPGGYSHQQQTAAPYPPQQQPVAQPFPDASYQGQYQQPDQQQPAYSPHGTPAPGQPYYPPQQYPPQ